MRRAIVYLLGLACFGSSQVQADESMKAEQAQSVLFAIVDSNRDGALDAGELQVRMKAMVKLLDADHNGKVSQTEMTRAATLLRFVKQDSGSHATNVDDGRNRLALERNQLEARVREAIHSTDGNDDGVVSCDELRTAVHKQAHATLSRLHHKRLKVEAEVEREARRWVERMSSDPGPGHAAYSAFAQRLAAGGDRCLTRVEVHAAVDLSFAIVDQNSDDVLSSKELEAALERAADATCQAIEADFEKLVRSIRKR